MNRTATELNKMCIMPGSEPEAVLSTLRESREAHRQAAAMRAKVFGAFLEGGEPLTGAKKDVGFCAKIPTHYRINKYRTFTMMSEVTKGNENPSCI